MWLTDEAAVTGRSVLAGTDDPRPVPLERLFAAAEAGEPVRLDVTVRGRDGVIVGIEEVPSDTGESPGRNGGSRRGQEPGQPESEEPQAEDGPGATDEELPEPLTDIEHGGQHWAVLWVGEYGDSELDRVREAIDQRWGPVWRATWRVTAAPPKPSTQTPMHAGWPSTSTPRPMPASSQNTQSAPRNPPATHR